MNDLMASNTEFRPSRWGRLSADEQAAIQMEKLRDLLIYAHKNSPFYRRRFHDAGFNPEGVKATEDLLGGAPFINKTVLMDEQAKKPPFGDLLTVAQEDLVRLYYSPGPLLIIFSHADLNAYIQRAANGLYHAGARAGDIVNISFNYNWVGAGTQHDDAYRRIGCAVLPGGAGMSETHIDLMKLTRTTVLSAFPTYAIRLAETAKKMGINPARDLNLRLIIIVGEIRSDDDKKQIGDLFGAQVREMYVGNEMGFVGSECPHGGGMHLFSDTLVEVVDPRTGRRVDPGQPGEIVTTDLHRRAMPIINYRTGDITEGLIYEECPCGLKRPRMKRILGRVGDIPRVKGMFIPPRRIELVLGKYQDLGRYQAVVDRPGRTDRFTIKIECPPARQKDDFRKTLVENFKVSLGILPEVEWLSPGTIAEDDRILMDLRKIN